MLLLLLLLLMWMICRGEHLCYPHTLQYYLSASIRPSHPLGLPKTNLGPGPGPR